MIRPSVHPYRRHQINKKLVINGPAHTQNMDVDEDLDEDSGLNLDL